MYRQYFSMTGELKKYLLSERFEEFFMVKLYTFESPNLVCKRIQLI